MSGGVWLLKTLKNPLQQGFTARLDTPAWQASTKRFIGGRFLFLHLFYYFYERSQEISCK